MDTGTLILFTRTEPKLEILYLLNIIHSNITMCYTKNTINIKKNVMKKMCALENFTISPSGNTTST